MSQKSSLLQSVQFVSDVLTSSKRDCHAKAHRDEDSRWDEETHFASVEEAL
jgi:hypothetical protein